MNKFDQISIVINFLDLSLDYTSKVTLLYENIINLVKSYGFFTGWLFIFVIKSPIFRWFYNGLFGVTLTIETP